MKIHTCEQGSGEWLALRMGVVTASEVDALVTPLWKVRSGEGVETYLYRKLCERLLGYVTEMGGGSFHMQNGSIMEGEAVPFYEFTFDAKVRRVGFVTSDDGREGCSPDGLIGEDGGIEIKCPAQPTHMKYLLAGVLPSEYAAQVHMSMLVTGRPWWVFMSYSRQLPPLVVRVERDEAIQARLREALDGFHARFDAALARVAALRAEYNQERTANSGRD